MDCGMPEFRLTSEFQPAGDQPRAIAQLYRGLCEGAKRQTLLGVTGSGKTFTMANLVQKFQKPTLVLSHNKTLAAQLYAEFRRFFPDNAVAYFVSYYDYYQPEAYIPARDIYIEKDAAINEDLDRLRLAATSALLSRQDVIVVASVSCIYGLGSPELYGRAAAMLEVGRPLEQRAFLRRLTDMQYKRADYDFKRGTFRVRGDALEIFPSYAQTALRVELDFDAIVAIQEFHALTGRVLHDLRRVALFPAKHYVLPDDGLNSALVSIRDELDRRCEELKTQGKLLEEQRLRMRTLHDLEMIETVGYCSGIENYSRHLDGRAPGSRPYALVDFFPKNDFLLFVDESHVTLPQVRGMYLGDRSRKSTLVEHGFRLPSALDNRPMMFEEFEAMQPWTIYVSATPNEYELRHSVGCVAEQIVRPTGLVDPQLEIRPTQGQLDDLKRECRTRAEAGERVLITTLTKRLAELLAENFNEAGLRCRYLHSELDALDRIEVLQDLRQGAFDVLVGVNLLREGLDLPEVSFVAILDADKEGFLRSKTSLIQTIGRAARNTHGRVILYADQQTPALRETISETERRRQRQVEYNESHGITPQTIRKPLADGLQELLDIRQEGRNAEREALGAADETLNRLEQIKMLEEKMEELAADLRFEEAAKFRDRILEMQGKPALGGLNSQERRKGKKHFRRDGLPLKNRSHFRSQKRGK
jgi:excinuclease ABC subunit B